MNHIAAEILIRVVSSCRYTDPCALHLQRYWYVWSPAAEILICVVSSCKDTDLCGPQLQRYWLVWSPAAEILISVVSSCRYWSVVSSCRDTNPFNLQLRIYWSAWSRYIDLCDLKLQIQLQECCSVRVFHSWRYTDSCDPQLKKESLLICMIHSCTDTD